MGGRGGGVFFSESGTLRESGTRERMGHAVTRKLDGGLRHVFIVPPCSKYQIMNISLKANV